MYYVCTMSTPKCPKDINEIEKHIVDILIGETQDVHSNKGKNLLQFELGRLGGLKGDKQGQNLSAQKNKETALKAVEKRIRYFYLWQRPA